VDPAVPQDTAKTTPKQQGQPKVIELKNTDSLAKRESVSYQVLVGNVWFYHDGVNLYCDSSYYDEGRNTFEAFSNVRMEQGDTIFLYGNYMHYDGNTQLIKVRENVRLEKDTSVTLFTDSLDYDRIANIGYYFDGGMLVDSLNELTSYWGQYEPGTNIALFSDSVKLVNPQFVLYSDTLRYNTETKVATFLSPTKIVSDSGVIYTSNGWYNTETEQSLLLDQSTVVNVEGNRILRGDSMLYNKAKGFGEVFGNMFLQDTIKKVILRGHYGYYDQNTDYAMATDSAYVIEYSQKDSLFMHADTLKLEMDSVYRKIKGYYGVRFYRADLQGVCDSMQFNSKDSILHLYRDPVLWNEGNQLSGDTIDIFMNDSTIDYIHVKKYSFSIEQKDSIHFNQLKSRSMRVYFENQKARRVFAEGDVKVITYAEERDKTLTGLLTYLECSYLDILFNDGALEKLKGYPAPEGYNTPFHLLEESQLRLEDFYWYDYLRPLDKDDIFRKVTKKSTDMRPKRSIYFDQED
jgi:lipopolysaccharide export system protein LptA